MKLSTEARVGAVTLVGLILLLFMAVQLGEISLGRDKGYIVYAEFKQVGGLRQGNVVRYAGVDIGTVQAVEIVDTGVRAGLKINSAYSIPKGSQFSIGTDGLLGEKYISITPPSKALGTIAAGDVVQGIEPQGLDTMLASADRVMIDMQKLMQSMNDVIGDEKVKKALKESAVNLKEITANLNILSASLSRMAVNNEQDINMMVKNLAAMSISLRDTANRVDVMLADIDNNGQTAANLRETLANLRATSERVEKMAAALEGVATDPETARNIKETLRNAREASDKAAQVMRKVSNIKAAVGIEGLYGTDNSRYRGNADIKINYDPESFAVIGASGIGDNTRSNFQIGKTKGMLSMRGGVVESKLGMGVDADLNPKIRLSMDAYDPNDFRLKLRAQYELMSGTYLVGQTDSINKSRYKQTYVGLRRSF